MSSAKRKPALAPALNNPLPLETFPGESDARSKARAMVRPSINAAMVIEALQQSQRNLEAFLGLALKAQAQSRATITALVDLKFPRQPATFVKQANIAAGNQQVNNGGLPNSTREGAHAHGKENNSVQNKLLEADHGQPGGRMDTRAAQTAERSHQAVETVATVDRAKNPRG